jgi:hypothetical protein
MIAAPRARTAIGPRDGRILPTAGKRFPSRLSRGGGTDELETTCSQGIPEKRRRVGRRFHPGSCSTRAWPDTSLPANDQGRQGSDRLRRPLALRHLGAHRPRRQAFARWLRARLSCGGAASGFGGGDHTVLAPLRGDHARFLHPADRSPGASTHDPRVGGASADVHHGGFEAPSVRDAPSFHRVRGESDVA